MENLTFVEITQNAINQFKSALEEIENSEYYKSLPENFQKIQLQAIRTEIETLEIFIRKEKRIKRLS